MLRKPAFPRVWIFISTRTSSRNVQGHFSARSSCIEQQPLKVPKCHSLSPHPHGLYTISSWNASLWRLKNTALKYFVIIFLRGKKKANIYQAWYNCYLKASGSQHRKHDVIIHFFNNRPASLLCELQTLKLHPKVGRESTCFWTSALGKKWEDFPVLHMLVAQLGIFHEAPVSLHMKGRQRKDKLRAILKEIYDNMLVRRHGNQSYIRELLCFDPHVFSSKLPPGHIS